MVDSMLSGNGNLVSLASLKKVPCEVYSRVVGYIRPLKNWNKGMVAMFNDRKMYRIGNLTSK